MTRAGWRLLLAPLVQARPRHLSVVGSAARKPLVEVGDLDLFVVVDRMTLATAADLLSRAEECAAQFAASTGGEWVVETFRSPVQPTPASGKRQMHLLIDDLDTLQSAPRLLLRKYAAGGVMIGGRALPALTPLDAATLRASAPNEALAALRAAIDSVERRVIAGRDWRLSPRPELCTRQIAARTNWQLRAVLKTAIAAGDWFFPAAMESAGIEPIGPALAGYLSGWQRLASEWPSLSDWLKKALLWRASLLAHGSGASVSGE